MDLRADFLEAMSRAATFVAVVATDGEGGRFGVTVSSLTSVSADGDHPSVLACIHHLSPVVPALLKNRAFCANLLAEDQQGVSDRFAGRGAPGDHQNRWEATAWTPGALAQPRITGATAALECRLATALLWETHHIVVGRVASVHLSDNPAALIWGQRAYARAVGLKNS